MAGRGQGVERVTAATGKIKFGIAFQSDKTPAQYEALTGLVNQYKKPGQLEI